MGTTLIEASGLVAWFGLCLEIMVGTMASAGLARQVGGVRRKHTAHQASAWVVWAAIGAHIGTILAVAYQGWGWQYIVELGWGTAARQTAVGAVWALLAVTVAAAARPYLPSRVWTPIHRYGTFTVLAFATFHAVTAGDGHRSLAVIVPGVAALTFIAAVLIVRWSVGYARKARRRPARVRGPVSVWWYTFLGRFLPPGVDIVIERPDTRKITDTL
jgi:hypothetical protein